MAIDLSTIATGIRLKPPKVVIYGVGGIGKTSFAAGAPKPVFLFTEEGQGMLDVKRFEPRKNDPVLKSWTEIIECLTSLYNDKHDYETVVIDTIDFAEPMLWKYTAERYNKSDIEAFGYGKGYLYAVDEARVLFQWLDVLRNDRNMAVVIVAHSETKKFESPDVESYDRYKLALQDRLAAFVRNWSETLLFANYKTVVVKDDEGFNKTRNRAVGVGERVIYTEERPAFWAKNRYTLPFEMPLSWAAFQNGIVIPETKEPKPKTKAKA